MKKILFTLIISLFTMCCFSSLVFADDPAPVPPGGHGTQGNQVPTGAPVDGFSTILIAMGAIYGGYKLAQIRKKNNTDCFQSEEKNNS